MMSKEVAAREIPINGIGGFLCTVSLCLDTTVADVKAAIQQEINVLWEEQVLLIGTKELEANEQILEILLEHPCSAVITLVRQHPAEAALLMMLGITRTNYVLETVQVQNACLASRQSMLAFGADVMKTIVEAAAAATCGCSRRRSNNKIVPWVEDKWGSTRLGCFNDRDPHTGQLGFLLVPNKKVVHAYCFVTIKLDAGLKEMLAKSDMPYEEDFHEMRSQGWTLADLCDVKKTFPSLKTKQNMEKIVKDKVLDAAMIFPKLALQTCSLQDIVFSLTYTVHGWDGNLLGAL